MLNRTSCAGPCCALSARRTGEHQQRRPSVPCQPFGNNDAAVQRRKYKPRCGRPDRQAYRTARFEHRPCPASEEGRALPRDTTRWTLSSE